MVDCIHHKGGCDHTTTEVAPVEAPNSVLTTLNTVELDVNLSVIVIECQIDVDNVTILLFAFRAYVVFGFLLPVWIGLPDLQSVKE